MAVRISQDGNTQENKYLYQGKELNQTEKLNICDFHARQYDPLLGRFTAVDPAGQFASGYVGMANNPTTYVDPTGMVAFGSSAQQHTWSQNRQVQSAWDNLNAVGPMQASDPWASFEREMELLMVYGGETVSRMMQSGAEYEEWVRNQDYTETKAELESEILVELDRKGVKLDRLPEDITLEQMEKFLKELTSEDKKAEVKNNEEYFEMEFIGVAEDKIREHWNLKTDKLLGTETRQQGNGVINVYRIKNGEKDLIGRYSGVSGPMNNGLLPDGAWKAYRPSDGGIFGDETGFKFKMILSATSGVGLQGRGSFRIHPTMPKKDGFGCTTEGCVGLDGGHSQVKAFYDQMKQIIQPEKYIILNVNILGNADIKRQLGHKTHY